MNSLTQTGKGIKLRTTDLGVGMTICNPSTLLQIKQNRIFYMEINKRRFFRQLVLPQNKEIRSRKN
jgi:hypothetical protein